MELAVRSGDLEQVAFHPAILSGDPAKANVQVFDATGDGKSNEITCCNFAARVASQPSSDEPLCQAIKIAGGGAVPPAFQADSKAGRCWESLMVEDEMATFLGQCNALRPTNNAD